MEKYTKEGKELLDLYYNLSLMKEKAEAYIRQTKMGLLVGYNRSLTDEETKLFEKLDSIFKPCTVRYYMESLGFFFFKQDEKGEEIYKSLKEIQNEYKIFEGKTEKEINDLIYEGETCYAKQAEKKRIKAFNEMAKELIWN